MAADQKLLDDVDMDYTVSFPQAISTTKWYNKPPVVFVFGWAGCQDRYLAKYSTMYEEHGCITVRYTPPVWRGNLVMASIAENLYQLFDELDLKGHPLFFHNFSGNGCWLYCRLMQLINTKQDGQELRRKMYGLAFDSSPAKTTPYQSARAITFALYPVTEHGYYKRFCITYGLAILLAARRAFYWLCSWFSTSAQTAAMSHYDMMLEQKLLPSNQLYLFSKADQICDYRSIERFIGMQRKSGAQTRAIVWDETPHCEHGRHHPQHYKSACVDFVDHCMAEKRNSDQDTSTEDNGFEHIERENNL